MGPWDPRGQHLFPFCHTTTSRAWVLGMLPSKSHAWESLISTGNKRFWERHQPSPRVPWLGASGLKEPGRGHLARRGLLGPTALGEAPVAGAGSRHPSTEPFTSQAFLRSPEYIQTAAVTAHNKLTKGTFIPSSGVSFKQLKHIAVRERRPSFLLLVQISWHLVH